MTDAEGVANCCQRRPSFVQQHDFQRKGRERCKSTDDARRQEQPKFRGQAGVPHEKTGDGAYQKRAHHIDTKRAEWSALRGPLHCGHVDRVTRHSAQATARKDEERVQDVPPQKSRRGARACCRLEMDACSDRRNARMQQEPSAP